MQRYTILFFTFIILSLTFTGNVKAQETQNNALSNVELSANVGLYSQYVFRGISQSDEGPALQGGFDAAHSSGLYAGTWASNVDFNDASEASLELDLYAGYANNMGNIGYDVGFIYYAYPGADSALNYDYYEFMASLSYDLEKASITGAVNFTPENFGETGNAIYTALDVNVPIQNNLSANLHAGYQTIDDEVSFGVKDYLDWSVGLDYTVQDFTLSAAYVDTNLSEPGDCTDNCAAKLVFGISTSF